MVTLNKSVTPYLIIIPAYNEEKNIEDVLVKLNFFRNDVDVLVVNDGSTDLTEEIVLQYPVYLASHPTNLGYVNALHTGFKFASKNGYDFVIQFDADGQHDVNDLDQMIDSLSVGETDLVIGSRYKTGQSFENHWLKEIAILFFKTMIRFLSGKKVTDPTSGFRGYKRRVFEKFVQPNGFPNEYPDSNFILELLLNDYNIKEVGVTMHARKNGKSMHSGIKPILYLFQVTLSIFIVWLRFAFKKKVMTK